MGEVARSVNLRIYPFAQLANTLIQCEQLKVLWLKYPDMDQVLNYSRERRDWNELSRAKKYFLEISEFKSEFIMNILAIEF